MKWVALGRSMVKARVMSPAPTGPKVRRWYERHWPWWAAGIVLVSVLIGLALVSSAWLAGPDAVKYVDAARSLARGEGYRFNSGREAKHPPGFSLLLSLLFRYTTDPFWWGRVLMVLTAGLALFLAGLVLRRTFGAGLALMVLACVAASVPLWWSSQSLLSEHPYAVFQNVALLLLLELAASPAPRKRDALLFGGVTAAALLIRSTGVILLAACAYVILRQRCAGRLTTRQTAILAVMTLGLPLLAFAAWRTYTTVYIGTAVPENVYILRRGYLGGDAAALAAMIAQSCKSMLSQVSGLFFGEVDPGQYPSIEPWLWILLLLVWLPVPSALALRGLWRAEPVWVFLGVYLLVIALWPLAAGATGRLCWPVAPFLLGLLAAAWRGLAGRVHLRWGSAAVSVLLAVGVVSGQLVPGGRLHRGMRASEQFWITRLAELDRIREQFRPAPPEVWAHLNVREAVYVFDLPTTIMEFTWGKDGQRWARELEQYRPDYIVVPHTVLQQENTRQFLDALTHLWPTAVCVGEYETVRLYRIPRGHG